MKRQLRGIIRQKILNSQAVVLPVLTRRDTWVPLVKNKAVAVTGMRRSGKSSLLWQLLAERMQAGKTRDELLYFSFEDERLAGMEVSDLSLVLEEFFKLHPGLRDNKLCTFFLDEIQVVPGWEGFARRLLDTEKIELFLSGSSARLLSREVATSMRGRAMEALVTPFSFREMLRHIGIEPVGESDRFTKAGQSMIDHHLRLYLVQGGFPEAQGLDERTRIELLRGYVDIVLLRDILERYNMGQPQVLRWMVQQLLGNPGGFFSINKFYGDLRSRGIAVSKETLHQMLASLEDAFLLHTLEIASTSIRRRQVNLRKVYPTDTGLISLVSGSAEGNYGHALESVIYHELMRRGATLGYIRTRSGFEVDFHASFHSGSQWLVQVCDNPEEPATLQRELRALMEASHEWHQAHKVLIVTTLPDMSLVPADVEVLCASNFLLSDVVF